MKKAYVSPELEDLGTLEELTLGQSKGSMLDADYTAGTLFGDLTFS